MLTGTYLTRCLVMSLGVGMILGDVETGLLMGAAGELAFLGFGVSSGGSVPPNPVGPGIIGAIIAITMRQQGMDIETALACSFPFAILIQFMITGIYTLATGLLPHAQQAAKEGRYGRFRLLSNSTFLMFVLAGFLVGFFASFQADTLGGAISLIPDWMTRGLGTAGKMLPAVGFAVILSVMVTPEIGPFVLAGYVMAAFFHLPVIGIALAASSLAWLEYQRAPKGQDADGRAKGGEASQIQEPHLRQELLPRQELRKLSRKAALRAYFLQNSFNYGNYEGTSYAAIMLPALRRFYPRGGPQESQLRQELQDSMGFCSCNPNFLPILTCIHLTSMNRGLSSKDTRDIRLALMGPMSGIGDSFVQFCLAPIFSTLGAAMAKEGLIAGPILFLFGMNAMILGLKLMSEAVGFQAGSSLMEQMEGNLGSVSRAARMVGSAVITGLAVTCVDMRLSLNIVRDGETVFQLQEFLDTFLPGALPMAYTGLLFYLIKKRNWSMYRLAALTLAAGLCFGILGIL